MGQLKYFLGLEVAHSKKGISLCQRKYYIKLLSDSRFLGSKPTNTPTNPSIKLFNDNSPPHMDVPGYIRLIGCLLYLTTIRLGISFITQQLSQFFNKPSLTHSNATTSLFFPCDSSLHLIGVFILIG